MNACTILKYGKNWVAVGYTEAITFYQENLHRGEEQARAYTGSS